jgi:hypothetical protein
VDEFSSEIEALRAEGAMPEPALPVVFAANR